MNRLHLGLALLTLWTGLNLLLAVGIVVAITLGGTLPPAVPMFLPEAVLATASEDTLALFRSMGVLLNAALAAICGMALLLVWTGVRNHVRWAWCSLALGLGTLQVGGFLSDMYLANVNVLPNLGSAAVLVVGLVASHPSSDSDASA